MKDEHRLSKPDSPKNLRCKDMIISGKIVSVVMKLWFVSVPVLGKPVISVHRWRIDNQTKGNRIRSSRLL